MHCLSMLPMCMCFIIRKAQLQKMNGVTLIKLLF